MNGGLWENCVGYLWSGGWLMIPTALAVFGIWVLYLSSYLRIRRDLQHSEPHSPEELEALVGAGPRLARAARALSRNEWEFTEKYAMLAEAEDKERSASALILGALVTGAPLLGLLGTVVGMIGTFSAVASGRGDIATMVADGVRLALVTTQAGLVAALPGTFGIAHIAWKHHILRSRLPGCGAYFRSSLYGSGRAS